MRTLALLGVSTCVSGGGGGAGTEARAHDTQVFAREAGLLLQLALAQRRQRGDAAQRFAGGGQVGQEEKEDRKAVSHLDETLRSEPS